MTETDVTKLLSHDAPSVQIQPRLMVVAVKEFPFEEEVIAFPMTVKRERQSWDKTLMHHPVFPDLEVAIVRAHVSCAHPQLTVDLVA